MAKSKKPTKNADQVAAQQAARAAELRKAISGGGPGASRDRPPTPRELTDEAARIAWEKAKGGRRS